MVDRRQQRHRRKVDRLTGTRRRQRGEVGAPGQRLPDVAGEFGGFEGVGDQRPSESNEVVAFQFGRQTHPVIGRQRVGAGVGNDATHVQPNESVSHPGARRRYGQVAHIGESALRHHRQQLSGAVQVGLLQPGRRPSAIAGILLSDHRHDLAPMPHRNRPEEPFVGHHGAHRVTDQQRGGRVGPALRDADQVVVLPADPQQVVPEGHVSQQLPLADDGVQVIDGAARQDGVLGEQFTESRHGSTSSEQETQSMTAMRWPA